MKYAILFALLAGSLLVEFQPRPTATDNDKVSSDCRCVGMLCTACTAIDNEGK